MSVPMAVAEFVDGWRGVSRMKQAVRSVEIVKIVGNESRSHLVRIRRPSCRKNSHGLVVVESEWSCSRVRRPVAVCQ